MSTLYQDLPYTDFPNDLDTFLTYLNITATDGPLIKQYMDAMDAGNQVLANQILAQIPSASQKIIKATDLNKLTQAMLAVERFYHTDIEPFVENQQVEWLNVINQFNYEGIWTTGTTYQKNNIVTYTLNGLTLLFLATQTVPVGTPPSNSTYWRVLTIQGLQGTSGQGLAYRQEWIAAENYQTNNAVTYNGSLWMALQPSTNIEPGTNEQYWKLVMGLEATTYPIQATQPAAQNEGELWFNTSENPPAYYKLDALDNPVDPEHMWLDYEAYDDTGTKITGTFETYTRQEILGDDTVSDLGLQEGAVPNDAFQALIDRSAQDGLPTNDIRYYKVREGNTIAAGDVVDIGSEVVSGTTFGELPVGSIVQINENSSPVNYIVVNQGIPTGGESLYDSSCDGTWLLRQDIAEQRVWDANNSNQYASSDINTYLNGDWMNRYDSTTQGNIKTVKIPYCVGSDGSTTINSGANGLSVKAFLLGGYEVGWDSLDSSYFPADGRLLDYFEDGTGASANQKRIANFNGSAAYWWLRSPYTKNTLSVWYVLSDGDYEYSIAGNSWRVRPCIILNSSAVHDGVVYGPENVFKNMSASQNISSHAIALESGNAGETIAVGFGGYCECPNVTTDQSIAGTGNRAVNAISPQNNWLWINPVHIYPSSTSTYKPFAETDWAEIAEVSEAGLATEFYNLGDTKDITLTGIGTMTVEIADFDHDYLSGSTGAEKAGISLITKDLLYSTRQMNTSDTNNGGFPDSALYDYLSTTVWNALPAELRNVVKTIYKWYGTGNSTTNGAWHGSKLWVPLEYELFGSNTYSPATEHTTGNARKYPIFTDDASRIKKLNNGSGNAPWYWEASPRASNAANFCIVDSNGYANSALAAGSGGVCFGLCI